MRMMISLGVNALKLHVTSDIIHVLSAPDKIHYVM